MRSFVLKINVCPSSSLTITNNKPTYFNAVKSFVNAYFLRLHSDFESLDEDTQVVATARGKFTSQGGVLSSPESGVSIVIPEGAIPQGVEQEIYFKVCKDNNFMPPLDSDRGIVQLFLLQDRFVFTALLKSYL